MKRLNKAVFLFLFLILLTQACADPHAALFGKWQVVTSLDLQTEGLGGLVFDFQKDGILRVSVAGTTVDFSFAFVDDNTIRFVEGTGTIQNLLAGQELDFQVQGDTLSLISNGEAVHFTRVTGP
jgi:hypothetical protein